ncbi:MAG: hypothetical protein AB1696_11010 [Planctomycetota bacterium]
MKRITNIFLGLALSGILVVCCGFLGLPLYLYLPHPLLESIESATVGSLKTLAVQQAIFRQQCEVDQNGNGIGEYGFLAELCGELVPRNPKATAPVCPAYISQQFATGGARGSGIAEKSGYYFQLWLPGPNGPMNDSACDGTQTKPGSCLDPDKHEKTILQQESSFVIYAWPVELGSTGFRTFFVNEIGETYSAWRRPSHELPSELWFAIPAALGTFALLVAIVLNYVGMVCSMRQSRLWLIVLLLALWVSGFAIGLRLRPPGQEYKGMPANYGGLDNIPRPDAAFRKGDPLFTGRIGEEGNDGNFWRPAG